MQFRSITCLKAPPCLQGFILPSAIFLLVVLAALSAFMLHVSSSSQVSSVLDLQGARAQQAARVGIEAALYQFHRPPNACPTGNTVINLNGAMAGFRVVWSCSDPVVRTENGFTWILHRITSTASYGQVNSNDYVERQIAVTTERCVAAAGTACDRIE